MIEPAKTAKLKFLVYYHEKAAIPGSRLLKSIGIRFPLPEDYVEDQSRDDDQYAVGLGRRR